MGLSSPPPIPLEKWSGPVTVTHVENPGAVWISLDKARDNIMLELETADLKKLDATKIQENKIVGATFSEDGANYRAKVKKLSGRKVEVRFCDFGNTETVDVEDITKLPQNLETKSPVAVLVVVDGNEDAEDNTKNRERLEKKLSVEELMVKLTQGDQGKVSARFAVKGKKIKFSKSKEKEARGEEPRAEEVKPSESQPHETRVKAVEVSKSSGKVIMCSQLPALSLLEKVKYSGVVNYCSAVGSVWFSPQWMLPLIDDLSAKIEDLGSKNKLEALDISDVSIGLLCLARSGVDGVLYRARVINQLENSVISVKYIDYGDSERIPISSLFYFPPGLDMNAPGAEEIVLARHPQAKDVQSVLESTILGVEGIELVLETDETGSRVGRFYHNDVEMKWDEMVDAKEVFTPDAAGGEEDVVVEVPAQETKQEESKTSKTEAVVTAKPEETKNIIVEKKVAPVSSTVSKSQSSSDPTVAPKAQKVAPVAPKLQKVVPAKPFSQDEEHKVFVVHVESVSKVWVCREEDSSRVDNLMDKLAGLTNLESTTKVPKGAVFAARYSLDDELYRVVPISKQEDQFLVQFIDFGNMETKPMKDLFIIPEEISLEPSSAVLVTISTSLEETKENRKLVEALLNVDKLVVVVHDGVGKFTAEGNNFEILDKKIEKLEPTKVSSVMSSPAPVKSAPAPVKSSPAPVKSAPAPVSNHDDQVTKVKALAPEKVAAPAPVYNPGDQAAKMKTTVPSLTRTEPEKVASIPETVIPTSRRSVEPSRESPKSQVRQTPKRSHCFEKAIKELKTSSESTRKKALMLENTSLRSKISPLSSVELRPGNTNNQEEVQWRQGDMVNVKCSDGEWRITEVIVSKPTGVFVSSTDNNMMFVETKNVRPSTVPTHALNLVDKDINSNAIQEEALEENQEEEFINMSSVIGKVKDWMDKSQPENVPNIHLEDISRPSAGRVQKKLPDGSSLVEYCNTSAGSSHVQSALNSSSIQLARYSVYES